jgi:hypothetical protein
MLVKTKLYTKPDNTKGRKHVDRPNVLAWNGHTKFEGVYPFNGIYLCLD